jgi:hypothetical protein
MRWPLVAVLVVQAGLSLRLVWSNTAFEDEALYLWAGHLEWAHWLHGTPIPDSIASPFRPGGVQRRAALPARTLR